MKRIIQFVQKERLYILILIFVLLFNAVMIFHGESKSKEKARPGVTSTMSRKEAMAKKFEENLAKRKEMEIVLHKNDRLMVLFGLATLLMMALTFLGIVIDAILLPYRFSGRILDIHTYVQKNARWGLLDIGKVIILFLFFTYMFVLSEASLSRIFPILKSDNFRMIANTSFLDTIAVVLILYFTVHQYKEKLASLGLSLKNFLRNIFYGIVGYIALIPILMAILVVMVAVMNITKYIPERQPVVDLFLKEKDVTFLTYSSLFAAVGGPIIEELFFRGFMYGALKKYIGIFWAMILTAAIFAVLHAQVVGFLPIMALGILLAYVYEKTGTLVSSITVHIMHNLSMVFLVFLVKQAGIV